MPDCDWEVLSAHAAMIYDRVYILIGPGVIFLMSVPLCMLFFNRCSPPCYIEALAVYDLCVSPLQQKGRTCCGAGKA